MELFLKRLIIMVVTISVTVPSIYYTMSFYNGSQYEKDPANFLPADTNFVAMLRNSGNDYYLFVANESVGIMTSLSVFMIPQIIETSEQTENITVNATLSYFEEYRGVSIFVISGVNALEIVDDLFNGSTFATAFLNTTDYLTGLDNLTFYVASPRNTFSIIGSVNLLENSIDAYSDHAGISSVRNIAFNKTSNLSAFYYPTAPSNIEHVSINISYSSSEMYVSFVNLSSSTILTLSTIALRYGIQVYLYSNSVEFVLNSGIWPLIEFIESRGGIQALLDQLSA